MIIPFLLVLLLVIHLLHDDRIEVGLGSGLVGNRVEHRKGGFGSEVGMSGRGRRMCDSLMFCIPRKSKVVVVMVVGVDAGEGADENGRVEMVAGMREVGRCLLRDDKKFREMVGGDGGEVGDNRVLGSNRERPVGSLFVHGHDHGHHDNGRNDKKMFAPFRVRWKVVVRARDDLEDHDSHDVLVEVVQLRP